MSIKRFVSLLLVLLCISVLALCGCNGAVTEGKNADIYGSEVSFEGEAHDLRVMFVNVGKADCAVVDVDGCGR